MQKRLALLLSLLVMLGGLLFPLTAHANIIHLRYFESADAFLTTEQFQQFSFSALQEEKVTLVAYGLEDGLVPALTLLDVDGRVLAEALNVAQNPVVDLTFVVPQNGLYNFLVSRQSENGGLVRVMLFEGDPLKDDLSLLDTIDPFLPSRAFLLGGDDVNPVRVRIAITENMTAGDGVFASRGTQLQVPPQQERFTPVKVAEWLNDNGQIFYTLNIRTFPEPLPTTFKNRALFAQTRQASAGLIRIDVNEGGEPTLVDRPQCVGFVQGGVFSNGPSAVYNQFAAPQIGAEVEIVGQHSTYFLVVDPSNPTGGSWIDKSHISFPASDDLDCGRVQEMSGPTPNESNSIVADFTDEERAEATPVSDAELLELLLLLSEKDWYRLLAALDEEEVENLLAFVAKLDAPSLPADSSMRRLILSGVISAEGIRAIQNGELTPPAEDDTGASPQATPTLSNTPQPPSSNNPPAPAASENAGPDVNATKVPCDCSEDEDDYEDD